MENNSDEINNNNLVLQNNANLKMQLLSISSQIEQSINHRKSRPSAPQITQQEKFDITKTLSWLTQIENMKKMINETKHEIESNHNYLEIAKNENLLKEEKGKLLELKKEFDTLSKIKREQDKSLKEVENKYHAKTELVSLTEKLKNLREEYKILKDYNIVYGNKIKKQEEDIIKLNDRCNLIKENIEDKKRKNGNSNEIANIEEEIEKLSKEANENKKILEQEEKNYINAINRQNDNLIRLEEENSIISIQIKHKEQETKINEFKLKELIKISSAQNNNHQNVNSRYNNGKTTKKNIRIVSKSNKNYDIGYNYGNNRNNINSFSRKNIGKSNQVNRSERIRPFVIRKFGEKNNYNRNVLTPNSKRCNITLEENNIKENIQQKKSEVMDEIEKLKKDIQIALNEENDNYYDGNISRSTKNINLNTEESKKVFSKTYNEEILTSGNENNKKEDANEINVQEKVDNNQDIVNREIINNDKESRNVGNDLQNNNNNNMNDENEENDVNDNNLSNDNLHIDNISNIQPTLSNNQENPSLPTVSKKIHVALLMLFILTNDT